MKILNLRIFNLASLAGEHFIDFESEPLKSAGLIAITGSTGAGKSTLLDAMCLALFDQVARLQKAEGKLQDVNGDDIQIKSSVNVLRRGTAQGFAEVSFVAQDSKHYRARWEVKRARLKIDGKLQAVQRSLYCLSDERLISERSTECNEQVVRLLGLDFSQFTRAVLLAQSEVGAFLKAKENERADLLEYLTSSDIYSHIGQLAFAANKQAREIKEKLEEKIGSSQPLNAEQRAELEQQLLQTKVQQQHSQQQYTQCELQTGWYQQLNTLQQHVHDNSQHVIQQQNLLDQAQPHSELLLKLKQFEEIRLPFVQQQQLASQYKDTRSRLQQQQMAASQLKAELANATQQQQLCSDTLTQAEQHLKTAKPLIAQAQQLEFELQNLQDQQATQQQELQRQQQQLMPLKQQQGLLETEQQQLNQQQAQQQQLLQNSKHLQGFDGEPQASIRQIEQAAKLRGSILSTQPEALQHDYAWYVQQRESNAQQISQLLIEYSSLPQLEQLHQQVQQEGEQLQAHLKNYERLEDQLKHWQQLESSLQLNQQQQQDIGSNIAQQMETLKAAQQQANHAESVLNTTRQLLNEQRLLFSQHVENLRQQLKPDEPCMVCGSTEHPYLQHSEQLLAAKTRFDEQKEHLAQQQLKQAQLAEQQQQQILVRYQTQQQGLTEQASQLSQDKQQLLAHLAQINPRFYQQLAQPAELAQALGLLQQGQLRLQDKVQKNTGLMKHYTQQLKHWRDLTEQQQQLEKLLEHLQQLQQLEQSFLPQLLAEHQQAWLRAPLHTQQIVCEQIQLRVQAQQQLVALEKSMQENRQKALLCTQDMQQRQHNLWQLNEHLQQSQQQLALKQHSLGELFAQYAPLLPHAQTTLPKHSQHWQQLLENAISQARQQLEQAQLALQEKQRLDMQLAADIQLLNQQQVQCSTELAKLQAQISHWQQQHPQLNAETMQQLAGIGSTEKQRLEQQLQDLKDNLFKAQHALQISNQQLQAHQQLQPQQSMDELQSQQQLLSSQLETLDQQRQQLAAQLLQDNQRLAAVQQYQQELQTAQTEYYRWHKINQVIGDATGKTFRNIAQHYHLQILLHLANQQLAQLSNRYELRPVADTLGLLIVDHDMNDEVRPVLSLSGGETFLVSLALALGIAAMASGNTRLESLFIDEGFGTLDPASLHMVMDALDRLQDQGRKVILISHIQDMHERIPVKIQVIPQGSGASNIEVTA